MYFPLPKIEKNVEWTSLGLGEVINGGRQELVSHMLTHTAWAVTHMSTSHVTEREKFELRRQRCSRRLFASCQGPTRASVSEGRELTRPVKTQRWKFTLGLSNSQAHSPKPLCSCPPLDCEDDRLSSIGPYSIKGIHNPGENIRFSCLDW